MTAHRELAPRLQQVADLRKRGLTQGQIAARLGLAVGSVRKYFHKINSLQKRRTE